MTLRRASLALVVAALAAALLAGGLVALSDADAAARAGRWTGQATSKDSDFKYGKVSFRVRGRTIRDLKIESVTVSGCGGLGMKTISVPRLTIKGTRFSGSYRPVPDVDDVIIVRGTISGSRARGTFSEGPLCVGEGRFTARAR
jgi:nitrous oxidase accessory protein NosD